MRKQSLGLFFTVLFFYSSFAQTNEPDLSGNFKPRADTPGTVNSLANPDAEIYNGKIHIGYLPAIKGIAYHLTGKWETGSVTYHNLSYKNIFLKYDLVHDEVVIKHYNGFSNVALFTPRVQSFCFLNSTFVYLEADRITSGLYEQLKTGRVSLYARRTKFIKDAIVAGQAESEFIEKDAYFVLLDGVFHQVKKQNDLMNLLKETKNEITSHLKTSGINFNSNPEAVLLAIVDIYNQRAR